MKNTLHLRKLALMLISMVFTAGVMHAQDPYITVWKTDNPGSSTSTQIQVPASGEYTYTWEQVGMTFVNGSGSGSGTLTLTFSSPGTYRLKMTPAGTTPLNRIQLFSAFGATDAKKLLDIEQWGDIAWSSLETAYYNCTNLVLSATDTPNLASVTNMNYTFYNATSLIGNGIPDWDVSSVTSFDRTFYNAALFNQPLDNWDVGNATIMYFMFYGCRAFNQPLNSWDVSNVTNMSSMFYNASSFDQPLNNWDVGNVTAMNYMFYNDSSFNHSLDDWDVHSVTQMVGMFSNASSFNQPLNSWDVSNVNLLGYMFAGAVSFDQPLNNWNVGNVTSTTYMFYDASSFNQSLASWNVGNISTMHQMFTNATAFNQDLGTWTLRASGVSMTNMLNNSGLDCENYSSTLYGWANSETTPPGVGLGAVGMTYSTDIADDRTALVSAPLNWLINGDAPGICSVALPVSLGSFTAAPKDKLVLLNWTTLSEQNNSGFELQRSNDAHTWNRIAFVNCKNEDGNSAVQLSYNYTDQEPLSGLSFYRLKTVSFTGAEEYSQVEPVQFEGNYHLTLSPNPVKGKAAVSGLDNGKNRLILINSLGQTLKCFDVAGTDNYEFDLSFCLPGLYFICVENTTGTIARLKIIKE